jgi:hypothetical protein
MHFPIVLFQKKTNVKLWLEDISNPLVCPHMNFYPEDANGSMSEAWHGAKWLKDLLDDMLTPMVVQPETGKHFFVGELCRLYDNTWFSPQQWFWKKDAGMWALGLKVSQTEV